VTATDQVIRWTTAGAVVGVAEVAAVASYEHAYALVRAHGEDFRSFGPPSARARKWLSLLTSQSTRPRRGGDDVHQLTACTGLRPSGQADLRALGLLRRAIAALPPRRRRNSPPASQPGIHRRGRDPRAGHADCPPVPVAPGPALSPRWSCSGCSSCALPR
jgi:hypothetical protein